MQALVHVTHEATHKIGGIGTVLHGLLTAPSYVREIGRSILVGTWSLGTSPSERLGTGGRVLYSVCDGIDTGRWRDVFRPIEERHKVWITYGTRRFEDREAGTSNDVDVLLIEASSIDPGRLTYFKATLYQRFGIASAQYEAYSDFEHWMRISEPAYEAAIAFLRSLGQGDSSEPHTVGFLAHEYMGMPTILKAVMEGEPNVYTAFYAHEVATIRPHVENHAGHDTRFYNLLRACLAEGRSIDDVLGDQSFSYRHALITRAWHCDAILAVGDWIVEEFRFLGTAFRSANIELVYNGIPAYDIDPAVRKDSHSRLARYCGNLLGYVPDYVFTHVTRFVQSKALWRDLRVLEHLDPLLAEAGRSAVLFLLSTEIGMGRPGEQVHRMEAEYGWPIVHRDGYPDLTGNEGGFYRAVEALNRRTRAVKVVFVNQFGWSRERCGMRMPENMEFMDIRQGSDVEFGMSIYEPFGIAQVEPLSFGAICVQTNVCGNLGFVRHASGDADVPNVLVADFTRLDGGWTGISGLAQIGWAERDSIERAESARLARELMDRLPRSEAESEALAQSGYEIARRMSWEVVARDYLLPSLSRAREARGREA